MRSAGCWRQSQKNLDFIPISIYSYTHPGSLRASSRDVSRMEPGAAPAVAARNRGTGRPWVAVRPHYEGLPLMAGRGADEGRRKLPGSGPGNTGPSARGSTAPGTEIAAVERREARLRRHGGDAPRQACRPASPAPFLASDKPRRPPEKPAGNTQKSLRHSTYPLLFCPPRAYTTR